MAKTIVISGANYSANSFDTVSFDGYKPCTAIELNNSTIEIMAIGGTNELIATTTPMDTSDTIDWESSDTSVATVVNGLVTTVGIGIATITVTCGTQSANCVVTSRAFMDTNVLRRSGIYSQGAPVSTGGNGLPSTSSAGRYGVIACSVGVLHLYGDSGVDIYPYVMPAGTKRLKVSAVTGGVTDIYRTSWIDHNNHASGYSEVATLVALTSITNLVDGEAIIDVPELESYTIDSIVLSVRVASGATTTDADLEGVVVEFLPATNE